MLFGYLHMHKCVSPVARRARSVSLETYVRVSILTVLCVPCCLLLCGILIKLRLMVSRQFLWLLPLLMLLLMLLLSLCGMHPLNILRIVVVVLVSPEFMKFN